MLRQDPGSPEHQCQLCHPRSLPSCNATPHLWLATWPCNSLRHQAWAWLWLWAECMLSQLFCHGHRSGLIQDGRSDVPNCHAGFIRTGAWEAVFEVTDPLLFHACV